MDDTVIIAAGFRGPPETGNGGYVGGLLAERIASPAEATLRRPVPLAQPLTLERNADDVLQLRDGTALLVECRTATLDLEVPTPPSFEVAARAAATGGSAPGSTFGGCFVCGRERADGMRIFAAPFGDGAIVAATWLPEAHLADDTGRVAPRYHWAALDCPGAVAVTVDQPELIVTGRMVAEVCRPLAPGERAVVIGWPVAEQGRKRFSGTAIFSQSGELAARALTTWIVPRADT